MGKTFKPQVSIINKTTDRWFYNVELLGSCRKKNGCEGTRTYISKCLYIGSFRDHEICAHRIGDF